MMLAWSTSMEATSTTRTAWIRKVTTVRVCSQTRFYFVSCGVADSVDDQRAFFMHGFQKMSHVWSSISSTSVSSRATRWTTPSRASSITSTTRCRMLRYSRSRTITNTGKTENEQASSSYESIVVTSNHNKQTNNCFYLNARWNMLSEQYFKNTTWPSVENIESMIPNGS